MNESPAERERDVRTIVADKERNVRQALAALSAQGLGMQVVGEADCALSLQREVRLRHADLVIVAWDLVAASPVTSLAALRDASAGLRVVVLGLRPEARDDALAAGADGYISMVDAPDVVARVLQSCTEHRNRPGGLS
jgi:DNA-binding NarL/FixJ family response regulator